MTYRRLFAAAIAAICSTLIALAQEKPPTKVILVNGEVITAPVVWDDTLHVWFEKDGKVVFLDRSEVKSIERPPDPDFQTADFDYFLTQGGETIAQLAACLSRDAQEIAKLNGLAADEPLQKGLQIRIQRLGRAEKSQLASVENFPPNFSGISPTTVFKSLGLVHDQLVKSKFETTAEFEARLAKLLSQVKFEGSKSAGDILTFVIFERMEDYDADTRSYSIKVFANPASPYALFNRMNSQTYSLSDTQVSAIRIADANKTLGSSVGQNAFGVKKRYMI